MTFPVSVTTNALPRENATEVGRSSGPATGASRPRRSTRVRVPVFGDAGEPGPPPDGQRPCASAYRRWSGPNSTSTTSGAPAAICTGRDHGVIATTLPSSGGWGTCPARPTNSAGPAAAKPVGTTVPRASSSRTCPSFRTYSTRSWWPSVTANPPR